MIRYHFNITMAYGKVKRTYPMATTITLVRAERVWNRNML